MSIQHNGQKARHVAGLVEETDPRIFIPGEGWVAWPEIADQFRAACARFWLMRYTRRRPTLDAQNHSCGEATAKTSPAAQADSKIKAPFASRTFSAAA